MKCELMIIGSGIAGMAASLFAANNNIKTFQAGMKGEFSFSSGLFDLMGVYPVSEGRIWENPFDAIDAVSKDFSCHPLAKMTKKDIDFALKSFLEFLNENDLPYYRDNEKNQFVITGIGTIKPSHCVPESMMAGVKALNEKSYCLIIDIQRMKGFSSKQIAETLKGKWPKISSDTIVFPDSKGEVFAEHLAISLENPEVLRKFAENIIPLIKNNKSVGLPAILGMGKTKQVKNDLEQYLGVPVFEIQALPPSVPGIRIKNTFEAGLPEKGVTLFSQKKILDVNTSESGKLLFTIGNESNGQCNKIKVEADAAVLATGRFLGKGLLADYENIKESIFDLPVFQPENRSQWHNKDFFDKKGHRINSAGIEVDHYFRPLDKSGKPFLNNLFAIGSILAHNDWKRMKSGSGVSIASAYAAVNSYLKLK